MSPTNQPGSAFGLAPRHRSSDKAPRPCPCASGRSYQGCCARLHEGRRQAATAQELMRARYSAFAMHNSAYLLTTWDRRTRPEQLRLDPRHRWLSLKILETSGGGIHESTGTVRFAAKSRAFDGTVSTLTETSRFVREDGQWRYLDGEVAT